MTTATYAHDTVALNAARLSLLGKMAVAFGVFLSGFVLREPAPYELYFVGIIGIWAFTSMRISAHTFPLLALLLIFNLGGLISMTQLTEPARSPLYIPVSIFLALTAFFFAAIIERNDKILRVIVPAYIAAAVVTSLLGILGYFGAIPGGEIFTRYGRAAGAFEDPNVFGPFLLFPVVYLTQTILRGRIDTIALAIAPLLIIVLAIFLSFSRGAWGSMALSVMLMVFIELLANPSGQFRLRILVLSALALVLMAVSILVLLQIPQVAELFSTRAQLVQEYDGARFGRFARHIIGFQMAAENPLGIGPLAFGPIFGEDTHNIWLKALLDYSWLGFAAYLTLIVWTLAAGFKLLLRPRPWQRVLIVAYSVFISHILLGTVIDTDHWRHFYMLLGLIWGAIAAEQKYLYSRARQAP